MTEIAPVPTPRVGVLAGTRATSDDQLVASWLDSLASAHTRRNFETTATRLLAALPMGLRSATIEDVRDALETLTAGRKPSSASQYVLRAKSLLGYAHKLGYTAFNAGVAIKVRTDRGQVAKRIVSEVDVKLLIGGALSKRDRVLLATLYAGGLRVSELVGLDWADVIEREINRQHVVQLSVTGKGGQTRQVLLPPLASAALLSLREVDAQGPVFVSRHRKRLDARSINHMLKGAARRAGVKAPVSPHWLRHAHGSHALDRGATLPQVQETLGHANVSTTSAYLHARPDSSSGLRLDPAIFR